jgi:hypothetical protein
MTSRPKDLSKFLEDRVNSTGKTRCLSGLLFAAMSWLLWTICNKMVVQKVFFAMCIRYVFKFLFLQQ